MSQSMRNRSTLSNTHYLPSGYLSSDRNRLVRLAGFFGILLSYSLVNIACQRTCFQVHSFWPFTEGEEVFDVVIKTIVEPLSVVCIGPPSKRRILIKFGDIFSHRSSTLFYCLQHVTS